MKDHKVNQNQFISESANYKLSISKEGKIESSIKFNGITMLVNTLLRAVKLYLYLDEIKKEKIYLSALHQNTHFTELVIELQNLDTK